MKRTAKALAILGFTSTVVFTAFGQGGGPAFSFDEFGNSTGPGISSGVMLPVDPSGGIAGPVLVWSGPAL